MKARMPGWARVVSLLLALLCALLSVVLIGAVAGATSYPYQPQVVRVTGAKAQRTEEGCLVTLEVQNISSRAAQLEPDSFFFYDEEYQWVQPVGEMRPDYTNPFSSGWLVELPAGRSGSMQFLVAPPQGDEMTVYWYERDEEHQLVFSVE